MSTKTNPSAYKMLNIMPCNPDFTIHVYLVGKGPDDTVEAPREMRQHAYLFNVEEDPVAHHYVTDVLDHYTWPVVTITSGADLIAHWEGHRPDMLALIPTLNAQRGAKAA